jgi:hypothetical protein
VTDLPQYRDINQQIAREMGVFGLPITVILNPEGEEIARLGAMRIGTAPKPSR